jgi:hypothetical protein
MTEWSLSQLLASLHEDIQGRLARVRASISHPGSKGDASETVWVSLLDQYLPRRYQVAKAHVVDSKGSFSDQIDVVVFDRQYSPFIFTYECQTVIPAESVYAVFEAKQSANASLVEYAQKKAASVRKLHRTSLSIPHAGGVYEAKPLFPILAGLLTFESEWTPPLGRSLEASLKKNLADGRLDMGCVAAHGHFVFDEATASYSLTSDGKPATAFLLKLIALLQLRGTVPMIDVDAYAQWLAR